VDTLTKYNVTIEDKQYKIDLTKTENQDHFMVKIDDKPYKLELENKFKFDTPIQIKLGQKSYSIQIAKKEKQTAFQVKIKDISIDAEVKTQQINSFPQSAATQTTVITAVKTQMGKAAIEGAVTAPMAGKIVSIKVKKGEAVKAGKVVCILEAMKMENEMVAQKDGFVKEILVSAGASVNKGDPVFVIASSED
jgi:biotin carboxyl carrier protein